MLLITDTNGLATVLYGPQFQVTLPLMMLEMMLSVLFGIAAACTAEYAPDEHRNSSVD
jgi:hypothetical protein